ncbi:MAG: trigger factor [Nitrospirae bacterium]|nr:trigger factor [Nitrospirota bacterium]
MKVDMKEVSKTKRVFTIEVPSDVVSKGFSEAYDDLRKRVKVPGFRPGKAPLSLLERRYAKDVEADLIKRLVPDYYLRAVKESGVVPVDMPEIDHVDLRRNGPLKFTATVEVQPKIGQVAYEGIELKKEEITVTEKDIEERIEELRNFHAQLEVAGEGHAIEEGDYVQVDYTGLRDGKPVKGVERKGVVFQIGSSAIPNIDKGLIGARKGEEREIEYSEQNLLLKIQVAEIKKKTLPEVNDDFAKGVGGYHSLMELREGLKGSLLEEKGEAQKAHYREEVIKRLIERNPVEAPPSLVEREMKRFLARTKRFMGKKGEFEPEEEKSFREKYMPHAEEQIKGYLLLTAIGNHEGISAAADDVEEEIKRMAQKNGQEVWQAKKSLESMDEGLEGLKSRIVEDKVVKQIMDKVKWV